MKEPMVITMAREYASGGSEIAQAVGVENSNYFSVMFRKMRGISPQEYRNQKKSRI